MPDQLSEEHRQKLDSIVAKMESNGEPEDAIKFVVSDFKTKYAPALQTHDAKPEKTWGGFGENVVTSGGKFLGGMYEGGKQLLHVASRIGQSMYDPAEGPRLAHDAKNLISATPQIAREVGGVVKKRYGGIENIKDTLYNDPVGVLGDVATFADGVGLVGKLGGVEKVANIASKVGEFSNPVSLAGKALQPALREAGTGIVRATVRPGKALRDDFGGGRKMAQGIIDQGVTSEANAESKLSQSTAEAQKILATHDAQRPRVMGFLPAPKEPVALAGNGGVLLRDNPQAAAPGRYVRGHQPGIHVDDLVDSLKDPQSALKIDQKLGDPDAQAAMEALQNRGEALRGEHPSGNIDLQDANAMKTRAQEKAYESGRANLSAKRAEETTLARALRATIEERAPEVGPVNERSQTLLGAKRSMGEAEGRSGTLHHLVATGLFGAGMHGDVSHGVGLALALEGLNSPRLGAGLGIGLDRAGRVLSREELAKAALIARLTGQVKQ